MDYKLKGNISGYIGVLLLVVIFVLTTYLTTMDIHFKYDTFVILLLSGAMESCRDKYLDYRKREIEGIIIEL